MSEDALFPPYIPRPEEEQIRQQLELVREEGTSRVVLLYGPGGIGKTYLVREMARAGASDETAAWLGAIDVDDSDFWLLSHLERHVAGLLDPDNQYFGPYRRYLARLPDYAHPHMGRETVISHLGRIKRVFVDCYAQFVRRTGKAVVIPFDTVEAIRDTYLLVTLTQWMKALPATLFILTGRPMSDDDDRDPIRAEFAGPYQRLPVERIDLKEFARGDAFKYLNSSEMGGSLSEEEKTKLVHLTSGHPLWLATAISYLTQKDMPEDVARRPAADIERLIPYEGLVSDEGRRLQEDFKRSLVAPYREADFWHEAIKRLAVLRQAVNVQVWQRLMADTPLPRGVSSLEKAWRDLMSQPWIRPRANGRYVTLHDAMAEELAHRIIPLHDQDRHWQHQLWRQAIDVYSGLIDSLGPQLDEEQAILDERLEAMGAVDSELEQFRAARLFYQLLSDFELGCRTFLTLFDDATRRADFYPLELFSLQMYRFLPSGTQRYALGDVVGEMIGEFRRWLPSKRPGLYRDIGISIAAYLNLAEQQQMAFDLLNNLPMDDASGIEKFRVNILRGNACMRIAGRVKKAQSHFEAALAEANLLTSDDRQKRIAEAQKELGFYFRNEGNWQQADTAYRDARDAIHEAMSSRDSDEDREELASIHTNWAYVKGLNGNCRDGSNLAESAIAVRHRLNKPYDEGISWSVCGEVYRYERQFQKAWDAYSVAEQIFHGTRSWTWLGVIYQEQAICLFQATQYSHTNLIPGKDPLKTAKRLIGLALDICRDQAVRSYPSALNRAGRIFGSEDPDAGLEYLSNGIEAARRLSDGWFWLANLIEYIELSYRTWVKARETRYIDRIAELEPDIRLAMDEYDFPDLKGRWYLVQAHLHVHNWIESGQPDDLLSAALEKYRDGFALMAEAYVGSSGRSALPAEFDTFSGLFTLLPDDVQVAWQSELRRAWHDLSEGSTMLLARLEALR
jgi:tetratricopeptide (TPR) repeat protein